MPIRTKSIKATRSNFTKITFSPFTAFIGRNLMGMDAADLKALAQWLDLQ